VYDRYYDLIIGPQFGNRSITKLRRREIIEYFDDVAIDRGGVTANRALTFLKGLLNWGIDREYLDTNPAWRVKKPHKEEPRNLCLTIDEMKILYQVLEKKPNGLKHIHKALQLILLTGARKSEIEQSKWTDWDYGEGLLKRSETKTGKVKVVRLPRQGVRIIRELKDNPARKNCEYMFPHRNLKRNDHISESASLHQLKKCLKIGELPNVSVHDLRRSVVTNCSRLGAPDDILDKILNHKSYKTRDRYNWYAGEKEVGEWLQRLADAICPEVRETRSTRSGFSSAF